VGTHANCVADAAHILRIIAGHDVRDTATTQIPSQLLDELQQPVRPLHAFRIGIAREHFSGYHHLVDAAFHECVLQLQEHGIQLVDNVIIDHVSAIRSREDEYLVMLYEFKEGLNRYLQTRTPMPGCERTAVRTLADVIAYNRHHPNHGFDFDQGILERAEAVTAADRTRYVRARKWCRTHAGPLGIDAALRTYQVDAIIVPSGSPAWKIDHINGDSYAGNGDSTGMAACAGYPLISIPMGTVQHLPVGLTIMGSAWSEPTLISIAHGIEAIFKGNQR
jgi:amidase